MVRCLYPTLIDLCGLPAMPNGKNINQKLDGHSLVPFLENTNLDQWDGPKVALTAVNGLSDVEIGEIPPVEEQHFSVRSKNFRYCLWSNGFEELYDHRSDPNEWNNLAKNANYSREKEELKREMMKIVKE